MYLKTLTRLAFLLLLLTTTAHAQQRPACPPQARPNLGILVDARRGVFTLNPGAYISIPFHALNKDSSFVCGRFQSNTPVEVYILDPGQMDKFINGQGSSVFYNSGRVNTQMIYAQLPPGEYFLVINNRFSTFARKVVSIGATIHY